jgi:hypothetical protein
MIFAEVQPQNGCLPHPTIDLSFGSLIGFLGPSSGNWSTVAAQVHAIFALLGGLVGSLNHRGLLSASPCLRAAHNQASPAVIHQSFCFLVLPDPVFLFSAPPTRSPFSKPPPKARQYISRFQFLPFLFYSPSPSYRPSFFLSPQSLSLFPHSRRRRHCCRRCRCCPPSSLIEKKYNSHTIAFTRDTAQIHINRVLEGSQQNIF